ncbi:hypothetical protein DJ93_3063 [Bacillus clarus]|uniref:Uncharacterized protein n=1 Tax=Bacillus clarus TaxID=2338372 RepID=A0A090ZI58_9BACI|nr:hypothetical protein DJ93_3063 [Bacillus clarus]
MRLSEFELITIQAEVLFVHDQLGRMQSVNEPGNPEAPRFFLGCTRGGNITRYHYNLNSDTVSEIEKLIPACSNYIELAKIINVLNEEKKVENIWIGPAFMFTENLNKPIRTV